MNKVTTLTIVACVLCLIIGFVTGLIIGQHF
jgi:uncharacterized protein YneF (UPF0154 family)